MKKIILVLLILIILIGGGFYLKENMSIPLKLDDDITEDDKTVFEQENLQEDNIKTEGKSSFNSQAEQTQSRLDNSGDFSFYKNDFYSFYYPSDWTYGENKSAGSVQLKTPDRQNIDISLGFLYQETIDNFKNQPGKTTEVYINGNKYIKYLEDGVRVRFLTLADSENEISFFVATELRTGNVDEIVLENILSTVRFDLSKSQLIMDRIKNISENAQLSVIVANFRADAELYFDSNNYSYSGVCSLEGDTGRSNILNQILSIVDKTSFNCEDSKDEWVLSVVRKNELGIVCSDSTGFNGDISKVPTGLSCK